jgi:hypothetical protein
MQTRQVPLTCLLYSPPLYQNHARRVLQWNFYHPAPSFAFALCPSRQAGLPTADWDMDSDAPSTTPTSDRPFYLRGKFWLRILPWAFTLACILAGSLLVAYNEEKNILKDVHFEAWRICFFLAGLAPIWWLGDVFTRTIVWGVERSFFTVKNALYYAYAVRVGPAALHFLN